jgi:hypothetical protein
MTSEFGQIVNVPVPVAALPLVHEVLNRYYTSLSTPVVERIAVPGQGEWSREEVTQLHSLIRSAAGRAVMTFIAQNADKKVTYGAMAQAAGVTFNQLRAQLAWLSRHGVTLKGSNVWPVAFTQNSSLPTGQRYQYRMDKAIAQWWLDADASPNDGATNG